MLGVFKKQMTIVPESSVLILVRMMGDGIVTCHLRMLFVIMNSRQRYGYMPLIYGVMIFTMKRTI